MKRQFVKLYCGLIVSIVLVLLLMQTFLLNVFGDAQDELFQQHMASYRSLVLETTAQPERRMQRMLQLAEDMGAEVLPAEMDELYEDERDRVWTEGLLVLNSDEALCYFVLPNDPKIYRLQYRDDNPFLDQLYFTENITILTLFVALGLVLAMWLYGFSRRLTALDQTARAFAEGDFSVRASTASDAEVGRLNKTFNVMAQRIEALLSSQKQLSNAVAHELRSPIFRLQCQLDMLAGSEDDAKRQNYIQGIEEDLQELSDLVEELLQYARMESADLQIERKQQDVVHYLYELTEHLQLESNKTIRFSHTVPVFTLGFDAHLLQRALQNLLRNALRYAEADVELSLSVEREQLLIHIDDDGPGIPVDKREDVFQPFLRLDASRTREQGGYGLGLSIAKQIIELHQGELSIGDSPLGGARFTVTMV
ncbi:ATP-binding protein [Pseudoteredinibacter isoporae]|uniref:ATP-binding protein n=1 Tax=Pseudoteredinibacter isoporae TaxID=570281 RepID=UPI003106D9A0